MNEVNREYMLQARLGIVDAIEKIIDVPRGKVTDTMTLGGDLECDSLDIIEIEMELEDEFDVVLEANEFSGDTTVGHVVKLVTEKLEQKNEGSEST